MKKIMILTLVAFLAAPALAQAADGDGGGLRASELKIGYVVKPRLMSETEMGKAAAAKLEKELKAAQAKLEDRAIEIKELQEDIQKRILVLSDEEKKKVIGEHERQVRDAKRLQEDYQRELRAVENEILATVSLQMAEIINAFGTEHGYDMILDASALLYASDAADISLEIIKAADNTKWKL